MAALYAGKHSEVASHSAWKKLACLPSSVYVLPHNRLTDGYRTVVARVSDLFGRLIPKRHLLIILGFLGIFNVLTMCINLSVAIVVMTNFTSPGPGNATGAASGHCPEPHGLMEDHLNRTRHVQWPVFPWDTVTQGNILAAYAYGGVCTVYPSGWLASRYGGKYVFGIGILVAGIITMVIPKATEVGGANALIALRVLEGLATGFAYPAMHQLLAQWSPSRERTKLCAIVFTGAPAGSVVALALSGFVGDLFGWQWIFNVFGSFTCVWFVLWMFVISNTPQEHPTITDAERTLIELSQMAARMEDLNHTSALKPQDSPVPWRQILSSPPVWAIFFAQFGQNWGNSTLLVNLPTYMSTIQRVQLSRNGLYSALPYIMLSTVTVIGAYLSDYIRYRNLMTTTNIRKLCNTLGNVAPAVCIIGVGYVDCDWVTAVVLLAVGTALSGLTASGFQVNFQDISPIYTPVIFGLSTALSSLFAIVITPHVVGAITKSGQTEYNWRIVFYISAAIRLATAIVFAVFASGEVAPWNYVGNQVPAAVAASEDNKDSPRRASEGAAYVDAVRRRHTFPGIYEYV